MQTPPPVRFTIGAQTFRHGALSAAEEFHCLRRIGPVVKGSGALAMALAAGADAAGESRSAQRLAGVIEGGAPLLDAFAKMDEADADYVIHRCMGVTEALDEDAWVPTWDQELQAPAFAGLRTIHVMRICHQVLKDAIAVFFFDLASSFQELGLTRRASIP